MSNFLTKLFGNKSQRDLKDVAPFVDAAKRVYPEIESLDNDSLRAKTIEFKERIRQNVNQEEEELVTLRSRVDEEYDMAVEEIGPGQCFFKARHMRYRIIPD